MGGLNSILEEIKKENQELINKINSESEILANEIINNKASDLESEKLAFEKKSKKDYDLALEKGKASAISIKNQLILAKKQELIENTIEKAKNYIINLPKEEYFNFFSEISLKFAHKENGEIKLNKQDMERYGEDFVNAINKKLSENNKGSLVFSKNISSEKTGIVMVYNDIEENLSLDSLISSKLEILQDRLNSFLFN